MRLLLPRSRPVPVFRRGHAVPFPEGFGIVAGAGKAGGQCDVENGGVLPFEELRASAQTVIRQEFEGRFVDIPAEQHPAGPFGNRACRGDVREGELFPVPLVDAGDHGLERGKLLDAPLVRLAVPLRVQGDLPPQKAQLRLRGKLLGAVSAVTGGKGGGRPDSATSGGKDPAKVPEALAAAADLLAGMMK